MQKKKLGFRSGKNKFTCILYFYSNHCICAGTKVATNRKVWCTGQGLTSIIIFDINCSEWQGYLSI